MSPQPDRATEDRRARAIERAIGLILRGGVLLSLGLLVAGIALTFAHHPAWLQDAPGFDALLRSGALAAPAITDLPAGLARLDGGAFSALGLLVLILTPVMRVAVSLFGFAVQRDRAYVAITAFVLAMLVVSFVVGKAAG